MIQVYMIALKVVIFALLVERYKLRKANKFYKNYFAAKAVELSNINKEMARICDQLETKD